MWLLRQKYLAIPNNKHCHREQLIQLGIQMYQAEWSKQKFDDMSELRLEQAYAQISAGLASGISINDELQQEGLLFFAKTLYLLKRIDEALTHLNKLRFGGSISLTMFAHEEITRGLVYLQKNMREEALSAFKSVQSTGIETYADLASEYVEQLKDQATLLFPIS